MLIPKQNAWNGVCVCVCVKREGEEREGMCVERKGKAEREGNIIKSYSDVLFPFMKINRLFEMRASQCRKMKTY